MAYEVGKCLLRELLIKSDMTQNGLAEQLGVSYQQINKYYLDKQLMHIRVAKNISHILKCEIEDLYEWIEVGCNE